MRLTPARIIIGLVVLVPILALAWWLGSPLFLSQTVEEAFPMSQGATIPEALSQGEVEAIMAGMAKVDLEADDGAMAVAATALLRGELTDADAFHQGSGSATLYRLEDGSALLRLEDLAVTNGPDLHVILSMNPDPNNRSEVMEGSYLDLGPLKGNRGDQNYPLPPDVDLSQIGSVVIYCMPFHVIFSTATLTPVN